MRVAATRRCGLIVERAAAKQTGRLDQDQPLDRVDFTNLRARLRQNTVLEKLSNLWLTRGLAERSTITA